MDSFTFEAVSLKKLTKIRIGHDGKNPGSGWFLDKVVVKEEGSDRNSQTFICNRWLAVSEDDGLIVREITAGGSQLLSTTSYNVAIKTGNVRGAGTDANAYLKVGAAIKIAGINDSSWKQPFLTLNVVESGKFYI